MRGKLLISGAYLLASTAVWAQVGSSTPATSEAAAPAEDGSGVQDIVVTAQRRAENLTSVPLAISAQSGAQLSASGIKDLSDVRFNTPGMMALSGTGYVQIYIRGIGNGVFVGAEPSIATFYDDVPHVYGSLIEDLVNVERVEVLKGAQGGLYGRNASGGVINIITKQPSDKFSANARVSYAERGTLQAAAYVNMPLSDRIAWNFSLTRNQHKPYRKNVAIRRPYHANNPGTPGYAGPVPALGLTAQQNADRLNKLALPGKLNDQDVWSFDTKLRFKIGDRGKITFAMDYTDDQDASGNGWIPVNPAATRGTYVFLAGLYGAVPVDNWPDISIKDNKSYGAIPNRSWTEDYGASAKIEYGLDGVDLTSITALRYNNSQFWGDVGASPIPVAGFQTNFRRHFFYQELRAVSSGDGPFRWLGGVTYFKDHVDAYIVGLTLGVPGSPTTSKLNTKNWSIYGQASYDFTDNLTFQASLRYANEKKTTDFPAGFGPTFAFPAGTNRVAISSKTKVDKFIPAATLSYKLNGGVIYARYAKGFKTGGPNPLVRPDRLAPTDQTGLILKPETVDTYEVGYRATLFDRKVQFTSAFFYNKYKGIHTTTSGTAGNTDISNAIINLGNARTYGAEASLTWRVIPPLTLSWNIGYLNAKYQKAVFPGNALLLPRVSTGNRMIMSPKWQGGFQANLDTPLNDDVRLQASVLTSYISSHNFGAIENPLQQQKGYALVNGRIGVLVKEHYGFYLFGQNLFDKRYFVFSGSTSLGTYNTPANPRLLGATVEIKF